MRSEAVAPELTVVIPTLNEAATIPLLLADLAAQTGVEFEVLISDGGSRDGTPQLAAVELDRLDLRGEILCGTPGRGSQLNRGAARARGGWLLFLHADSRIGDPVALRAALDRLAASGSLRVAGRFALRFAVTERDDPLPYRYCEVKARLGLAGTIHGDQGFLLPAGFFEELGGFREGLAVLEDTLLAERIRRLGGWRLLPAEIVTSPRRFQTEGFRQRQTLNALLMNFATIGWDEPLLRAPEIYRSQDRTRPLHLAPYFRLVDRLLRQLSWRSRLHLWYRTGEFVRGNAWQIALWRAVRRNADLSVDQATKVVTGFRRWFEPLTAHPPGRLLTALLTWMWFCSQWRSR